MGLREKLHPNSFKPKMGGKKKTKQKQTYKKPQATNKQTKKPNSLLLSL